MIQHGDLVSLEVPAKPPMLGDNVQGATGKRGIDFQ